MLRRWTTKEIEHAASRRASGETWVAIAGDIGTSADNLKKAIARHERGVLGRVLHGRSKAPTYKVWQAMKDRCGNPKNPSFENYGGRGIRVCDEWLNSFQQFEADMGPRPPGGTLERTDNDGPYSPGNCRWASNHEQQRNRRNNTMVFWSGEKMTLTDACKRLGCPATHAYYYTKKGMSPPEALYELYRREEMRRGKNS